MMMKTRVCAAAAAVLLCLAGSAAASEADAGEVREGEWGSFKGRFVYDGLPPDRYVFETNPAAGCKGDSILSEGLVVEPKRGGIKNILVYLHSKMTAVHPDYLQIKGTEVRLDLAECRFEPHVFALSLDQTLVIRNREPIAADAHATPARKPAFLRLLQPGQSFKLQFKDEEPKPVQINSTTHTWMQSYVLPCNHPYFAVTDDEGRFEIKKLPAGFLSFRAWHEYSGYLAPSESWKEGGQPGVVKAKIVGGRTDDLGDVKVHPDLLILQP